MKLCRIGGENDIDNFYGLGSLLIGGENQICIQVKDSNLVFFEFDDMVIDYIIVVNTRV